MVAAVLVAALTSWFFARRVKIERTVVTLPQFSKEAASLLKLGLVFVSTGLMSSGAMFLIRTLITRNEGLVGTGQFQAAYALSGVYLGFVLQAMGTDFYPRLTEVANDNQRCNQLVNEQAEISILLALPGVLVTLAAAPWVIHFFYSSKFDQAWEILCWQVSGMFLQVNSWPMGFIIVAKGRTGAFFWTDFLSYALYVALAWLGLKWFGLPGIGMAFLGLYSFHWCIVYAFVRKISGFRWSPHNIRLSVLGVIAVTINLWTRLKLPEPWATIVGGAISVPIGIYCLKTLINHVGTEKIERYLKKFGLSFLVRKRVG
jgi:PST family polysaccharide transporter